MITYTQFLAAISLWTICFLCKYCNPWATCRAISTTSCVVNVCATPSGDTLHFCKNFFMFVYPVWGQMRKGEVWSSMDTPSTLSTWRWTNPYMVMPSCRSKDTWIWEACSVTVLTRTSCSLESSSVYVPLYTLPKAPSSTTLRKRTLHLWVEKYFDTFYILSFIQPEKRKLSAEGCKSGDKKHNKSVSPSLMNNAAVDNGQKITKRTKFHTNRARTRCIWSSGSDNAER